MPRSFCIVFSGGCYSGKTTAIGRIKALLESAGVSVSVSDENIRDLLNGQTIDEIRAKPDDYFRLQMKIISLKFYKDLRLRFSSNAVVLIDRSLMDSKYYFSKYVNVKELCFANRIKHFLFSHLLNLYFYISYRFVYDLILLFEPLDPKNCDDVVFRPKNLNNRSEFDDIKSLYSEHGLGTCKRLVVLHADDLNDLTVVKYER